MSVLHQTIVNRHTDDNEVDQEQLEAIFSAERHLAVEAPAGYGKTKTMVSKIAYLVATGQVPYPKKILALTFSINAAFKIRKDITEQLPSILLESFASPQTASQSVYATNYHGLCRRILGRYGHLIAPGLNHIDSFKGVSIEADPGDARARNKAITTLQAWKIALTSDEIDTVIRYAQAVKMAANPQARQLAREHLSAHLNEYLKIVRDKFLPKEYILFDAILLFTRQLFWANPQIRAFYRDYFPVIVVDEFQDTNILQWTLLQEIAGRGNEPKNHLYIFGDRYQKIYEFIGALEGIFDEASSLYGMKEIPLRTNHRFKDNQALLKFDANVRKIAFNPHNPKIETPAPIEVIDCANQNEEAERIITRLQLFLEQDSGSRIAILTRAGKTNRNTQKIVERLNAEKSKGLPYFFALYTDEDDEYVDFHQRCLSCVFSNWSRFRTFGSLCQYLVESVMTANQSETWASLLVLLETFLKHTSSEYRFLSFEEKVDLVIDTLKNKALKQYLMYVANARVTLSTIHGSKGLEWDYVILPDMEQWSFPTFQGLCQDCNFKVDCKIDWTRVSVNSKFFGLFGQELNVFYVGGTRARKSVCFTYSNLGLKFDGSIRTNKPSCFLSLQGLQWV